MILAHLVAVVGSSEARRELPIVVLDLSSESLKAARLRYDASKFFDVVLDEQGARKLSAAMAFTEERRLFGSAALASPAALVVDSVPARLCARASDRDASDGSSSNSNSDSDSNASGGSGAVRVGAEQVRAETLGAMLLAHVAALAEAHDGTPVTSLVLVAPLDADAACITALRDAARIAGLATIGVLRDVHAGQCAVVAAAHMLARSSLTR